MFRAEHGVRHNYNNRRIGDGVVGPFGLGLDVFYDVYLLGYAFTIEMVPLNLVLECEDIEGMETPKRCLEVGEKFNHGD